MDSTPELSPKNSFKIMELGDDELQYIFQFLDDPSLYNVIQTCKFFWRLLDNTFWEQRHPLSEEVKKQEDTILDWKSLYRQFKLEQWRILYDDGLSKVVLSNHNRTVCNNSKYNRFPVRLNQSIPDFGQFTASFNIISKGVYGWLGFGIMATQLLDDISELFAKNDLLGHYDDKILNIGYFDNGFLSNCFQDYECEGFDKNDIISIHLDLDSETCVFLKNSKQVGPIFSNIKKDGKIAIVANLSAVHQGVPTIVQIHQIVHKPTIKDEIKHTNL